MKIKKFAKARDKAYRLSGYLTLARANAISKIIKNCDYYSKQPELIQLKAVLQLQNEIITLLPHEESRFQHLRTDILLIIQRAKIKLYGHNVSQTSSD